MLTISSHNVFISDPDDDHDPIAPHYYEHITRTEIKRLFGCKEIPPYFWWDFNKYSCVPYTAYASNGKNRVIGSVVCARLRMDRYKGGDGAHIIPVDKNGEVLVSGTPEEFWWCTARGLALGIKRIIDDAPANYYCNLKGGRYGSATMWRMIYNSIASINKIEVPWNAKTLPSEVITSAYLWMQNYLDWWEGVDHD